MKKISVVWLVLIQLVLALEWLHSALPKWTEPEFINGMSKTLGAFSANSTFPGYAEFLTTTAIPHAELFGQVVRTGELAVGLALLLSGLLILSKKHLPIFATWLTVIALFGGAIMNLNFFAATGGLSPSAWGLNLMMTLIQIILGCFYIKSRHQLAETDQQVV